jgi:hypothetical protein
MTETESVSQKAALRGWTFFWEDKKEPSLQNMEEGERMQIRGRVHIVC